MKINFWQQFSSNNSSSYVIVGAFQSAEKAQEAVDEIRSVLKRIWDWYNAHPDEQKSAGKLGYPPTQAELIIAHDYGIKFETAIDWIAAEKAPDFVHDAVTAFENHVYIAVLDETLTHDTPFVNLISKLGGNIKHKQEPNLSLYINFVATAPDAITANYIKTVAERYLTRNRSDSYAHTGRPPWALFADGQLLKNLEQTSKHINAYLAHENAMFAWNKANEAQLNALSNKLRLAEKNRDQVQIDSVRAEFETLYETQNSIPLGLTPDQHKFIEKLLDRTSADELFEDDGFEVQIIEEQKIQFTKVWFLDRSLGHALPALVTWLRSLGCIDVAYEFTHDR